MKKNATYNWLFLSILCITPLIIVPIFNIFMVDYFYMGKILFVYIISTGLAILWFLKRESNELKTDSIEKTILVYLLIVIISTVFSTNSQRSLWGRPFREEGLFAIIIYVFLCLVIKKKYHFNKHHVLLFLLSASIVALYGISQYFGYDPLPRDTIRLGWKGRAFSTMGNPNFLGSFIVLVLPISIYAYIYSKKRFFLITSGILYLSLLCTMTRGAWIGALLSIIILIIYVLKYQYSRKHLAIILSILILITILFNIYSEDGALNRFATITKDTASLISQSNDYERAGSNRIFIWIRVLRLIKEKPLLGYGLETLDDSFTEAFHDDIIDFWGYPAIVDKAHNEYLHIAVSTGIPSLIIYLIFLVLVLYQGFKGVKHNQLIIPILCSILGYMSQATLNISVVCVAYVYWIFLGMIMNFAENFEKTGEGNPTRSLTGL